MRHLLLLLQLVLIPGVLQAAKATSGFYIHTQPDGTQIEVQMVGDEHNHYYLTRQGIMMLKDGNTLYVPDRQEQEKRLRNRLSVGASDVIDKLKIKFPHMGSPRVPVILVEFADTTFSLPNPEVVFDRYLNSEDLRNDDSFVDSVGVKRNTGSARQYFRDMSFGKFTPRFDVYGPVRMENPLAYYGKSNNTTQLCKDVCKAMDDVIDFSQYDSDGNGNVDFVYMIVAGYSESFSRNSSDCMWPQVVWDISGGTYDGKNVNMAGLSCELHAYPGAFTKKPIKRCSSIGLFVHEFGHALGLPDLYPNSPNASLNNGSLEYWDVMDGGEYKDNGGYTPSPYTAYERQSLDWFSIDTLRENGEYSLLPLDEGGKAYYILADSTRYAESYILENVQNRGWGYWGTEEDFQGKGHGLMIIHAYNIDKEFKRGILPNNYPGERYTVAGKTLSGADTTYIRYRFNSHYHCMSTDTILLSSEWIRKDYFGTYYTIEDYHASMMAVPFPGPRNVTAFNATSVSKAWIYQGDGLMHKSLSDICENDLGEVSFRFETDRPDDLPALHWNDGTEGLKDRLPCYNLQGMPVDADYRGWVIQGGKIRLLK